MPTEIITEVHSHFHKMNFYHSDLTKMSEMHQDDTKLLIIELELLRMTKDSRRSKSNNQIQI